MGRSRRLDRSELNGPNWTEVDRTGLSGSNRLKWTKVDGMDQTEPNDL